MNFREWELIDKDPTHEWIRNYMVHIESLRFRAEQDLHEKALKAHMIIFLKGTHLTDR